MIFSLGFFAILHPAEMACDVTRENTKPKNSTTFASLRTKRGRFGAINFGVIFGELNT